MIMGMTNSENEVEEYWKSVVSEIAKYNKSQKKKAELSLSYGYDIFNIDVNTFLEDCIRVTDKKMYVEKNKKKKQNKS